VVDIFMVVEVELETGHVVKRIVQLVVLEDPTDVILISGM
jgi:hypothetical protein